MNKIKLLVLLALFAFSANYTFAKELKIESKTCLEKAMTQAEMNECANMDFQIADGELNRIYSAIQSRYSEDKLFLKKLKKAQLAWIKLRDADFEMQFPHADSPSYYGSIFPTCADSYKTDLTLKRVAFLKEWLIGVEEGDSCAGSKQRAMTDEVVQTEIKDEIKEVCYVSGGKEKDLSELRLSINYGNGTVKGTYNYLPEEKDHRLGEIDGSLWKGGISAQYNFEQEGQKDTANIRIELKEREAIIQGEEKDKALGLEDRLTKIDCEA